MNLPHGYTNRTSREGDVVLKTYVGADAERLLQNEARALERLAGLLPVPELLAVDEQEATLRTRYVLGRHGQELIDEGHATGVVYLCGQLLRRLQSVPLSVLFEGEADDSLVIGHGDFGPQNLLIEPQGWLVVALVDWEWAHPANPIEDLAWAEWIVRTHHSGATDALPDLFRGYGRTAAWQERHEAMLARCLQLVAYSQERSADRAVRLWQQRLEDTARYS